MGSMRLARRAGTQLANTPDPASTAAAPAQTIGSHTGMSDNRLQRAE